MSLERLHGEHDFDGENLNVIRSCVEEFVRRDVGVHFAAVWLEAKVSSRHRSHILTRFRSRDRFQLIRIVRANHTRSSACECEKVRSVSAEF
jgi:hypothetical protein